MAAYFAYEALQKGVSNGKVRIFAFNATSWLASQHAWQVQNIIDPRPNITILRFPAHNNPRAIPQQSIVTFTNVEEIEFFMWLIGDIQTPKKQYLKIFDLPASDRDRAMKDLRLMGITASSLFPGYDGVCRELKELHF